MRLHRCLMPLVTFLVYSISLLGQTWQPPVDLSVLGQTATASQVAMDPSGYTVAVWYRRNGVNKIVQAATLPFGGSWSSPVNLSAAGQDAEVPQVGIDASGNAVAIWWRSNGSNAIIQAATLPFGGVWSSPVDLSALGLNGQAPQIAVDPSGNAVAVWEELALNNIVQAATLPFGGTWSSPVTLSMAGQNAQEPQVAVDSSGNAVAIWDRSDGSNTIIQAATLPFGGAWSSPVDLSVAGQDANKPQIAVNPSGNAVAVWVRFNGANTIIQAATLPFGGAWSLAVDVSTLGQDADRPQVGIDSFGNASAVWEGFDGSNIIIQTASLPFGGAWSTPINLSVAGEDAFSAQIAVNPPGNAIAVWQRSNGSNFIIQTASFPFGGIWSTPINLSAPGENAGQSQVSMDPFGDAVASWQRSNGFDGIIQASSLTYPRPPPIVILPPVNLQGAQHKNRFLTQTELYNVITWDPPSSGNSPVSYFIYRDGGLMDLAGIVPATDRLKFVDHNRKKDRVYTYYIVSVDSGGNRSVPASIAVPPID